MSSAQVVRGPIEIDSLYEVWRCEMQIFYVLRKSRLETMEQAAVKDVDQLVDIIISKKEADDLGWTVDI